MSVDLHLHTVHSDGMWEPRDLVEKAISLKLSHMAVTDHDTTAAVDEARAVAAGRIEVITGIEINTIWIRPDGTRADVHVLGYFFDPNHSELQNVLVRQQDARLKFVFDTIERLKEADIELTFERVKANAGIGSIGRPHLTKAIVECGGAEDVNSAFEKFMLRGSPYYVERQSVAPHEAVAAITAAGGVCSIAHPSKEDWLQVLIDELQPLGLTALEAYHRSHDLDTVRRLLNVSAKNGLVVTGGSDCHGAYKEYPPVIGTVLVPQEVVRDLQARVPVSTH